MSTFRFSLNRKFYRRVCFVPSKRCVTSFLQSSVPKLSLSPSGKTTGWAAFHSWTFSFHSISASFFSTGITGNYFLVLEIFCFLIFSILAWSYFFMTHTLGVTLTGDLAGATGSVLWTAFWLRFLVVAACLYLRFVKKLSFPTVSIDYFLSAMHLKYLSIRIVTFSSRFIVRCRFSGL